MPGFRFLFGVSGFCGWMGVVVTLGFSGPGMAVGVADSKVVGAGSGFTVETLNEDGAWCWFQDERALVVGDGVVFSSIRSSGTLDVTTYDLGTGSSRVVTVRENFAQPNGTPDDHNVGALLERGDGRLMVFYARHHAENKMFVRVGEKPGDGTVWGPEEAFSFGIPNHTTYANPFELSEEGNRIYLFWRGLNFWPTFSVSEDGGTSWTDGVNIIADVKDNKRTRPYVKYCSNDRDTIHLLYTDAHPRNAADNSIYHLFYRGGNLHGSDGRVLRSLAEAPVMTTESTRIYDGASSSGRAWTWDVALDGEENPVAVYATVPSIADHRYRYGRWDEGMGRWIEGEIAFGGTGLYEAEREYSGGICLDPDDTSVVYVSANVDPATGETTGTGKREIYRGRTRDGGESWGWEAVTVDSKEDNIRPIVPRGHGTGGMVLWMRGWYGTYRDYDTRIVMGRAK